MKNNKSSASLIGGVMLASVIIMGLGGPASSEIPEGGHWWPTHGPWIETQMLTPDEDPEDIPHLLNFGSAVAIDGDTLVVSTQFDRYQDKWLSCPGDDGCDWVYVFTRQNDGSWLQTAKLIPDDPVRGDTFGFSIAVDEDSGVIAVGNPGFRVATREGNPPGTLTRIDQVHVFEREADGVWAETAVLHRPAPYPDSFGYNVAVSGTTVASGYHPDLFVFDKVNGEWQETALLRGSTAVAMAGDVMVAGIVHHVDPDCGSPIRAMYQVYRKVDGEWTEEALLDPQNQTGNRTYTIASKLALSENGKMLTMGAPLDRRVYGVHTEHCAHLNATTPLGQVDESVYTVPPVPANGSGWIYELKDGEWVMTADLGNPMPGDGGTAHPLFGISVGASADRAVFGAVGDIYNGGGPQSGAVYVYKKLQDEWFLEAKLRKQDAKPQDWFGMASDISGDVVVAGADWSSRTGTVHAYEPLVATSIPDI